MVVSFLWLVFFGVKERLVFVCLSSSVYYKLLWLIRSKVFVYFV